MYVQIVHTYCEAHSNRTNWMSRFCFGFGRFNGEDLHQFLCCTVYELNSVVGNAIIISIHSRTQVAQVEWRWRRSLSVTAAVDNDNVVFSLVSRCCMNGIVYRWFSRCVWWLRLNESKCSHVVNSMEFRIRFQMRFLASHKPEWIFSAFKRFLMNFISFTWPVSLDKMIRFSTSIVR